MVKLRVLHCVINNVFMNSMMNLMNTTLEKCEQSFILVVKNDANRRNLLSHIRHPENVNIVLDKNFHVFVKKKGFDVIILHGFCSMPLRLIPEIDKEIKLVWFAWGYDIYSPIHTNPPLIKQKALYRSKTQSIRVLQKVLSIKTIPRFIRDTICKRAMVKRAINRVDFFSGVIPEEYELIRNNPANSYFRAKQVFFNYGGDGPEAFEKEAEGTVGFNIQIGNSASPENNHCDVFKIVSKLGINGKKIVVPLSYPSDNLYKTIVLKYGKKLFGEQFYPMLEYLPDKEYSDYIQTAYYSLFYTERQMALFNINDALYHGRMVFLSESSPLYKHLKGLGYAIYTIQHDLHRIENNELLTLEERENNKKIYERNSNSSVRRRQVQKLFDKLYIICVEQ